MHSISIVFGNSQLVVLEHFKLQLWYLILFILDSKLHSKINSILIFLTPTLCKLSILKSEW